MSTGCHKARKTGRSECQQDVIEIERQADRQKDRQTDRQTERQNDR